MKKGFIGLLLLSGFFILQTSCNKSEVKPNNIISGDSLHLSGDSSWAKDSLFVNKVDSSLIDRIDSSFVGKVDSSLVK
jgi:hypothetical protein